MEMINPVKTKGQYATLKQYLKDNGITRYELAKLTGMKKGTLYAYFDGRFKISDVKKRIIADALNIEVEKIFPEEEVGAENFDFELKKKSDQKLQHKNGSDSSLESDDTTTCIKSDQKQLEINIEQTLNSGGKTMSENEKKKATRITSNDMLPGCATLYQDDGETVVVHNVQVPGSGTFSGYSFTDVEVVMVGLGIKADLFDLESLKFKIDKFLTINHGLTAASQLEVINGELCAVVSSTGLGFLLAKGKKLGKLIF